MSRSVTHLVVLGCIALQVEGPGLQEGGGVAHVVRPSLSAADSYWCLVTNLMSDPVHALQVVFAVVVPTVTSAQLSSGGSCYLNVSGNVCRWGHARGGTHCCRSTAALSLCTLVLRCACICACPALQCWKTSSSAAVPMPLCCAVRCSRA